MPEENAVFNETEVMKDYPNMDEKVSEPKEDTNDSKPIIGPVMEKLGTISLFFGAVGVAILTIALLAGYIGFYAIPALLALGAVLSLSGHYLTCRKTKQDFSIVGAFQAA